jgi:hypothetical protein
VVLEVAVLVLVVVHPTILEFPAPLVAEISPHPTTPAAEKESRPAVQCLVWRRPSSAPKAVMVAGLLVSMGRE